MKLSPLHLAGAAVALVAIAIVYITRPPLLFPHPHATPEFSAFADDASPREHRPHASPSAATDVVYIAGAVERPGVYALPAGARVNDALSRAGGARRDADLVAVNLAAPLEDGEEIAVPRIGETPPATVDEAAAGPHRRMRAPRKRTRTPRRGRQQRTSSAPVDLNSADADALSALPGIGATLAQRIVEFRTLNGPFASVDGLADVSGITPSRLDQLEPLLYVSSNR